MKLHYKTVSALEGAFSDLTEEHLSPCSAFRHRYLYNPCRDKTEVTSVHAPPKCPQNLNTLPVITVPPPACQRQLQASRWPGSFQQESPGQELLHTHAKMHCSRPFFAHLYLCVGRTHTEGRPL